MSNSPKRRRLFPLCMLFKIPYYFNKLLLFQRANNIYFAFKVKVDNLQGWGEEGLSPSPTADHQGAAKTLWPDLTSLFTVKIISNKKVLVHFTI